MSRLTAGFYSLGAKINKATGRSTDVETEEGVVSEKIKELELSMSNTDILQVTKKWEKKWKESSVQSEWKEKSDSNVDYWKGKQYDGPKKDKTRPMVDNVIFESLETYLPQVTRRNPEPMIQLSRSEVQTPENRQYATELQNELGELADELVLRLKLKKAARHWALYLVGVVKMGWDMDKDIPDLKVIRPAKMILDPDATVDEDGYTGDYIGEHRKMKASELIKILEELQEENGKKKVSKNIAAIKELAKGSGGEEDLGTEIGFIEWWTDDYMCWTLDQKHVLLKIKNPHWDYGREEEAPYDEDGEPQRDEAGEILMEKIEGVNHFKVPRKPYVLLSVFNLGKQPVDDTSLIGQNLANQDLVNKRNKQIDKNADSMNGAMAVSGERSGLTKSQAKGVSDAVRKGGTIFIPSGSVQDAVARLSAPGLPADVYTQLQDTRNRMRDIFGTRGSSAAGLQSERTVRGKFQNRALDTDRIGGGFSEYLEQMADTIYNWLVQLLYVYDDRYAGKPKPQVRISVKEGSLLPKDSVALANQAMELAAAGKMSLIDLYKALDYPNPEEMAANVWLEANAPEILMNDPRIQQVMSTREGSAPEVPNISMNFKDLPPEGKAQAARNAGLNLNPEAIAAYDQNQDAKEVQKDIQKEAAKQSLQKRFSP